MNNRHTSTFQGLERHGVKRGDMVLLSSTWKEDPNNTFNLFNSTCTTTDCVFTRCTHSTMSHRPGSRVEMTTTEVPLSSDLILVPRGLRSGGRVRGKNRCCRGRYLGRGWGFERKGNRCPGELGTRGLYRYGYKRERGRSVLYLIQTTTDLRLPPWATGGPWETNREDGEDLPVTESTQLTRGGGGGYPEDVGAQTKLSPGLVQRTEMY